MMSPLRFVTLTATISSLKRPAACAASALFWDATANLSCDGTSTRVQAPSATNVASRPTMRVVFYCHEHASETHLLLAAD
jgi:hypothetical protein